MHRRSLRHSSMSVPTLPSAQVRTDMSSYCMISRTGSLSRVSRVSPTGEDSMWQSGEKQTVSTRPLPVSTLSLLHQQGEQRRVLLLPGVRLLSPHRRALGLQLALCLLKLHHAPQVSEQQSPCNRRPFPPSPQGHRLLPPALPRPIPS